MLKNSLAFLLVIGAFLFFYVNFNDYWPWGSSAEQEKEMELTEATESINIDLASVNTEIIPTDSTYLRAEATGKNEVELTERGNTITIKVKPKGFSFISFDFSKDDVAIYLPKDYHKKIDIEIGSGALSMEGFDKENPITLTSFSMEVASGNTNLAHINSKNFTYEGASGRLEADSLTTENGDFEMSSGRIDLRSYTGPLKAELASGSLDAEFAKLTDSIDISISSGKVNLDLPDDASFTLNGKTGSGNISNRFPLNDQESSKSKMSGSHGEGTHEIHLEVTSGHIDIY